MIRSGEMFTGFPTDVRNPRRLSCARLDYQIHATSHHASGCMELSFCEVL